MADLTTAIDFLQDINLNSRELLNVKLDTQSIIRSEGMLYYNTTTHRPVYYGQQELEIASLVGGETFQNKIYQDGVHNGSFTGTAIIKYSDGIAANVGAASDTKGVSEKYVIGAVVSGITANNARVLKGEIDCSTNPNYPAGNVGEEWVVSVQGRIGGVAGPVVEPGDSIICKTVSAAGDHATVGMNWFIIQSNINIVPVAKGGTNITTYAAGDLIYATDANTLARLGIGADNTVLTISPTTHLPVWSATQSPIDTFLELTDTPDSYTSQALKLVRVNAGATALEFYTLPTYDNYGSWNLKVKTGTSVPVTSGYTVDFTEGNGIALTQSGTTVVNFKLADMAEYTVRTKSTAATGAPDTVALTANTVLGRIAGNIVAVPFTTIANAAVHPLTDTYNTVTGLVAGGGQVLRNTDATHYAWSTTIWPNAVTINNILFASSANTITGIATANNGVLVTSGTGVPSIGTDLHTAITIGTAYIYRAGGTDVAVADGGTNISSYTAGDMLYATAGTTLAKLAKSANTARQFLSSSSSTNPNWVSLSTADIPVGIGRFYVHSYDSTENGAGTPITTLTVAAGTHGCGNTPFVWFLSYESATELKWKPAMYKIAQVASVPNGNVTIYTPVASKGKLLFMGV